MSYRTHYSQIILKDRGIQEHPTNVPHIKDSPECWVLAVAAALGLEPLGAAGFEYSAPRRTGCKLAGGSVGKPSGWWGQPPLPLPQAGG